VVLGGLTLVVLVLQWRVFRRQATLMERQGEIMAAQEATLKEQHALAEEQMRWRRDEAIGTFYRLAHDLVAEFRKANVLPMVAIPADFGTHPRQVLREASRVFAPLGNDFIFTANEVAMRLDQYFETVEEYNSDPRGRGGANRLISVQASREQVGRNLDRASRLISDEFRWKYADGKDYDFRALCAAPPGLLAGGLDSQVSAL
jgi:hypothetical protein